jgi:hypothetical protein
VIEKEPSVWAYVKKYSEEEKLSFWAKIKLWAMIKSINWAFDPEIREAKGLPPRRWYLRDGWGGWLK